MGFPIMNAHSQMSFLTGRVISATTDPDAHFFLPTGTVYPLFATPAVIDVTGMEFALALVGESATSQAQDLASGASTWEVAFMDMGSTATGGTTNVLGGADGFSNTRTGGYTVHEGISGVVGTSTTDLDADDWTVLQVINNATGADGVGTIIAGANFVHGKPAAIN